MPVKDIREYLEGNKLYGDDFGLDEITEWVRDERDAYATVAQEDRDKYGYQYHKLNFRHGFRFLPDRLFSDVLGFGSAFGDEFKPVIDKIKHITIIEGSDVFNRKKMGGVPFSYVKPQTDGSLLFSGESFDLITCFGVLHHIANVSKVIKEFYRCLKPDGYLLIREPTTSMGDWRKIRQGLTKRERGIPINIFGRILPSAGFRIIHEKRCMFSFLVRLNYLMRRTIYSSTIALYVDDFFCFLFARANKYHPTNFLDKLRPLSVFYVLRK